MKKLVISFADMASSKNLTKFLEMPISINIKRLEIRVLFSINSGLLEACVLALLSNEDSYGYKLTQDVKVVLSISESTLYPVLKRLQTAGYLETYDIPIDGRNRKYYQITAAGKRQLTIYCEEWKSYKKLIEKIFKGAQQ